MRRFFGLLGAFGLVLSTPLAAEAAKLSLRGQVGLRNAASPVNDARIVVTFHGHEMGIHEYTTQRRVRVRTDALGYFLAEVKVPDDRYIWTHATVEVAETDMSKTARMQAACQVDGNGGGRCDKTFEVNPLRP
jgi:hypothetical protein